MSKRATLVKDLTPRQQKLLKSIRGDRERADAIVELAWSKARYGRLEGIPARMVAEALGVDRVTLHRGLRRLFGNSTSSEPGPVVQ